MLYVRFPLSLRNVEDLLHERGIEVSPETVRYWWNRFGPMFASEIRRNRVSRLRPYSNWRWHLDEVFVEIDGETHYLWRAVDQEGEVLESYVTKRRDRNAALKLLRNSMKRYGQPQTVVTDKLRTYGRAMRSLAMRVVRKPVVGSTIGQRTHISRYDDESVPCFASGKCDVCRNLHPSKATSIGNTQLQQRQIQAQPKRPL